MAGNFANSYASVTWTTGDIITETKMDNMVNNDQAHDAFAAEGILLNNTVELKGKDSGSTNRDLIKIDANDDIQVGKNNEAGHTVINAGTNKLVKTKVLRQDNTSDTYENNSVVLEGWGFMQGDAVNRVEVETVTFGITFSSAPRVNISSLGYLDNSDPTAISDFDAGGGATSTAYIPTARDITTGDFSAILLQADNNPIANTRRIGYCWEARGQLNPA